MTPEDITLLQSSEDRILAIELTTGEQFFAEIVMVVDQPPTPDVFLLRVLRAPDGAFEPATSPSESGDPTQAATQSGESILLAHIARVARIPGIDYD